MGWGLLEKKLSRYVYTWNVRSSLESGLEPSLEPSLELGLQPGLEPSPETGLEPGLDPGPDSGTNSLVFRPIPVSSLHVIMSLAASASTYVTHRR